MFTFIKVHGHELIMKCSLISKFYFTDVTDQISISDLEEISIS